MGLTTGPQEIIGDKTFTGKVKFMKPITYSKNGKKSDHELHRLHYLSRTPIAWDVDGVSDLIAAPATLDLSTLVPVGARAVELFIMIYHTGGAVNASMAVAWDYDFGAYSTWEVLARGCRVYGSEAANTIDLAQSDIQTCLIGSSRKVYCAVGDANYDIYVLCRGYWI